MYTYKNGNATISIDTTLMELTEEDRRQWYRKELAEGNPILKEIAKAVNDCYRND